MSKRPRDFHIEHFEEPEENQDSISCKKRRLSASHEPSTGASQSQGRSKADVEEWENIKELFSSAVDKYEAEQPEEAAELFRQVIHESDHLLRLHPDPMQLLSERDDTGSFTRIIQQDGSILHTNISPLTSRNSSRASDPLATFHYIYGTSMLMLGKILEAHPSLAKDQEPVNTPAFYLAALDVLEDGENASHSVNSRFPTEDWRLAVGIGRTLVCIADEKLRRLTQTSSPVPLINFQDDLWPKDSAFGPSFSRRPPLTRRVALPPMTPHQMLLQAADQFSRAVLRMPHAKRNRRNHESHSNEDAMEADLHTWVEEVDAPPTMPGLGSKSRKLPSHIRPRVLYTIATDVLGIADKMQSASEREAWAKWADDIFLQMEMEEQTREDWSHPIAFGRGRCWLIIGSTRFEAVEHLIESSGQALECEQAEDVRHALLKAVEHLKQARGTLSTSPLALLDPLSDVSPMLGEAYVTLATLAPEGPTKEQFFARATAEGIDVDEADEVMQEAD